MQLMLGRGKREQENFFWNSDTCSAYRKRLQIQRNLKMQRSMPP